MAHVEQSFRKWIDMAATLPDTSCGAIVSREVSEHLMNPRHDLNCSAAEAGSAQPRFFDTDDGGTPKLPAVKWQASSSSLLCGRPFSDNILVPTQMDAMC